MTPRLSPRNGWFRQSSHTQLTDVWEGRFAPFLSRYCVTLCLCLVAIACVRITCTYNALSLTADEPFHLACGMEYIANHTYTIQPEQPPFSRALQALGPYLAGAHPTGRHDPRAEGLAILAESGNFDRTVFLMRLGNLPFFLLACCVVAYWSAWMFGRAVAVIATGLFTLLPHILADAGLATTDMALGATVGAVFLAAIALAEKPGLSRALLLGVCTALALLSKSSALGYIPSTLCLAFACYLLTQRPHFRQLLEVARARVPMFGVALIMIPLIVWTAYGFSYGIVPGTLISLPAPQYFRGVLTVLAHDRYGHMAFLLGKNSTTGWWYYFPVALTFKAPIAFIILATIGIFVCLGRRARIAYLFPLAFSLGILIPAMFGRINIGLRHIEPIFISLSILAALGVIQILKSNRHPGAAVSIAGALVAWMVVSVAFIHSDYLAYFNGLAGRHPENILVDSNYDWGQDLKFLARRLHQHGVEHFSLASLDGVMRSDYLEAWYGLPTMGLVDDSVPSPGWNVVSPSYDKSFRFQMEGRPVVAHPWYDQVVPTEQVGTLRLYYVPSAQPQSPVR
jgi:hypothetical protein